ncbi:discoidin domain-containing protein [Saccharophagus degradans]|uniref:galactose-binding domain-containing protein n=1 Tax=Saccharophagus degradans TaxID=86304 RepID=UPI002477E448|nr:discoidin domain-containing protein [Saccharophagus degradans]WGO98853.1 discoidin domain-containing protein [Saccharophagus degradans]
MIKLSHLKHGRKFCISLLCALGMANAQAAINVTASADDGNVSANTLDDNLDTRWSANGSGQWIEYDLGATHTVDAVQIAFFRGDVRDATIDIQVSNDGGNWQTLFSGTPPTRTLAQQYFELDDTSARYVRIVGYGNSQNNWNSITELDVVTLASGENIALGKATSQSSTGYEGVSSRAVDGNTGGNWNQGSITHTNNEYQPWWQVDLGSVRSIDQVNLWNRTNCCSSRLSAFYVLVSDVPFASQTLSGALNQAGVSAYYFNDTAGSPTEINIDRTGRYVRVQLSGTNPLSLAEVEVIEGSEIVPPAPTGPDASWTFCAAEREQCAFSNVKEVAYGAGDSWNYSIELDGVTCNNTSLGDPVRGTVKSCWIRNAQQNYVAVRNLAELQNAISNSNQHIRMKRGVYEATALMSDNTTVFRFDGANNVLDFTGVTIQVPTKLLNSMSTQPIHSQVTYDVIGDNITFLNGTFENTYPNGQHDVTDFTAHNKNPDYWPARQMTEFRVWGNGVQFLNNTITVRGSYPYGYGDMLGKGAGSAVYLRKHAGVQISGDNVLIDGMKLTVLAFGHGIFMQGADNTVIKNSVVQGRMRLGADMYNDGPDSLMGAFNFEQQYPDHFVGLPIVRDLMYNLTEDGIRAYTQGTKLDGSVVRTGAITVEDTKVINMRGCITTPLASKPSYIKNVEIQGCSVGYALANNSDVINSRGDAGYGPLLHSTYDTRNNANVEITVTNIPSTGSHAFAYIAGSGHNITFLSDGSNPDVPREIRVGDTGDRWAGDPSYQDAANILLINETNQPVVLTETSRNITGESVGKVTDNGTGNSLD